MQYVLIAIAVLIVGIGILFYQAGLYVILLITPTAPNDTPITISNYNAFQMYAREYSNETRHVEKKYLVEPIKASVEHRVTGNLAYRSTVDNRVCIIDVKDDKKFGKYGEGVDRYCHSAKPEQNNGRTHWAYTQCRNNTKGCNIRVFVKYDFFINQSFESNLITQRPLHRIN